MYESLKHVLLDLLKAPKEPPAQPSGSYASVRIFRASPGFLRYQLMYAAAGAALAAAVFAAISVIAFLQDAGLGILLSLLFVFLWFLLAAAAYVTVRLEYDLRYYVVTDRSLRIRRGVWSILEQTLTFANVQNVQVEQGPVERLFGISNLAVETAGGGSGSAAPAEGGAKFSPNYHRAVMRGLDDAEGIRDLVLSYVRKQPRHSGLGDPDEPGSGAGFSGAEIQSLREILDEARRIRALTDR